MSPFMQDLIALAMGLVALTYLARRWWPSAKALFKPVPAAGNGCESAVNNQTSSMGCGSGCGQCANATPRVVKDHRLNWVKQGRDASHDAHQQG